MGVHDFLADHETRSAVRGSRMKVPIALRTTKLAA
jgi:hypothetical protein